MFKSIDATVQNFCCSQKTFPLNRQAVTIGSVKDDGLLNIGRPAPGNILRPLGRRYSGGSLALTEANMFTSTRQKLPGSS